MTIAPQAEALVFDDIDDAVGALRARGLRVSIARRLVLELLFSASGPVSAEHVANTLGIDAASVYRNLEMLERHGLVHHVHLGHGPGLYVLVGRGEHEYLYCDRCATVEAVGLERLDPVREELRRSFGYEVRFTHFPIVGLCPACAAKGPVEGEVEDEDGAATASRALGSGIGTGGHVHPHPEGSADHAHDHSHGDHVHSHPHVHSAEVVDEHEHGHRH
jgi:Fur family ferric uptake transcriptional regulator